MEKNTFSLMHLQLDFLLSKNGFDERREEHKQMEVFEHSSCECLKKLASSDEDIETNLTTLQTDFHKMKVLLFDHFAVEERDMLTEVAREGDLPWQRTMVKAALSIPHPMPEAAGELLSFVVVANNEKLNTEFLAEVPFFIRWILYYWWKPNFIKTAPVLYKKYHKLQ